MRSKGDGGEGGRNEGRNEVRERLERVEGGEGRV